MRYRVYTPQQTNQSETLTQLSIDPSYENLFKILLNIYPHLEAEFRDQISEISRLPKENFLTRGFHFQEKYALDHLGLLLFKDNTDYEIYAIGYGEKIRPLLNNTLDKKELLGIANSWTKQGYKCWFVASSEPTLSGPLDPEHNKNKFIFEAIVGIRA